MCVCVCVCVCAYVYEYEYVCEYVCVRARTHVSVLENVYVCMLPVCVMPCLLEL